MTSPVLFESGFYSNNYQDSLPSLPKDSGPKTHTYALFNNQTLYKLHNDTGNSSDIDEDMTFTIKDLGDDVEKGLNFDLRTISTFVQNNLEYFLTKKEEDPEAKKRAQFSVGEINYLIARHNNKIESNICAQIVRILLLILTLGIFDFFSTKTIQPIRYQPAENIDGDISPAWQNPLRFYLSIRPEHLAKINPKIHEIFSQEHPDGGKTKREHLLDLLHRSAHRIEFYKNSRIEIDSTEKSGAEQLIEKIYRYPLDTK